MLAAKYRNRWATLPYFVAIFYAKNVDENDIFYKNRQFCAFSDEALLNCKFGTKNMDKRETDNATTLGRWMDAHRGEPGFEDALRKLVSYACSECFRRALGVVLAPEEALARMVAARLPDCPLGEWIEDPQGNVAKIAAFCENAKSGPLPSGLSADVPDVLDLRGVVCPGNAARSRLVMSGYPRGRVLKIDLDEGSPIENVPGRLPREKTGLLVDFGGQTRR